MIGSLNTPQVWLGGVQPPGIDSLLKEILLHTAPEGVPRLGIPGIIVIPAKALQRSSVIPKRGGWSVIHQKAFFFKFLIGFVFFAFAEIWPYADHKVNVLFVKGVGHFLNILCIFR